MQEMSLADLAQCPLLAVTFAAKQFAAHLPVSATFRTHLGEVTRTFPAGMLPDVEKRKLLSARKPKVEAKPAVKRDYTHYSLRVIFGLGWPVKSMELVSPDRGCDFRKVSLVFQDPNGEAQNRIAFITEIPAALQRDVDTMIAAATPPDRTRYGKTAKDKASTSEKHPTGRGAIRGPQKGPSPSADNHKKSKKNKNKK